MSARRRNELATTGAIIANAFLGLGAQVAIAARVGPGRELDAFLAATAAPLAIVGLGVSAFSGVILPALSRRAAPGGGASLEAEFLGSGVAVAAAIGVLGLAVSQIAALAAPLRGGRLLSVIAWAVATAGLAAQVVTVSHHFRHRFVLPAYTTMLFPIALGVAALGPWSVSARTLAAAYLAAALFQLLLLTITAPAEARPHWPPRIRAMAGLLRGVVPVVLATLPSTVFAVSDAFWTRRLPHGAMSYLGLATRLTVPIAGIATTGVATVASPILARLAADRATSQLRAELGALVLRSLVVLLPLAALGAALRAPLVHLTLERGAFGAADRDALAALLLWFLAGMVLVGTSNVVIRAFYALERPRAAATAGVTSTLSYVVLSGVLLPMGVYGIGLAYCLAWVVTVGIQCVFLNRTIGPLVGRRELHAAGWVLAGAAAVGAAATAVWRLWTEWVAGGIERDVAGVGLATLIAAALYVVPARAALRLSVPAQEPVP